MKFGQLIKCNMRIILLAKSYTQYWREASPWPFYKNINLSISLDQQWEMSESFFIVCPSGGLPKILKRICWPLDFTIYKGFYKKTKWGLELVSLYHFCMIFEKKKYISQTKFEKLTKFDYLIAFAS